MSKSLVIAGFCLLAALLPVAWAQETPPRPVPTYRHAYAAIDPTPASTPATKDYPGYRGPNQLVLYTPEFAQKTGSPQTGTNAFGAEAIVVGNVIQRIETGNAVIPPDGFVISGHSAAGRWIRNTLKPGMIVATVAEQRLLVARPTPAMYLFETEEALRKAEASFEKNRARVPAETTALLSGARQCLASLRDKTASMDQATFDWSASDPLLKSVETFAKSCHAQADRAYLLTMPPNPSEFRGIWLRPREKTEEDVLRVIAELKSLGIRDVFIETYYQGKTIYASDVLTRYGLAPQHPRFKNQDPLRLWLDVGHREGMRIHAWMQVFFAGNVDENHEQYGPILNRYPQWVNVQRAWLCQTVACKADTTAQLPLPRPSEIEPGHYFLDPANPEVRQFLTALFQELMERYPVDGVNLDYIRYPATVPPGSGRFLSLNWGYTPAARQAFNQLLIQEELDKAQGKPAITKPAAAKPPAADPLRYDPLRLTPGHPLWLRWSAWRKQQVSDFVQAVSAQLRQARPGVTITAVVFPKTDTHLEKKLQDWPQWVQTGYLDALTPIGLQPDETGLLRDARAFREITQDKIPVYPGLFGIYNRIGPVRAAAQVETLHDAGMPGLMLFEYAKLSPEYRDAFLQGPLRPAP